MYIGSTDEKSPFVYSSVFWGFDETLKDFVTISEKLEE